MKFEPAECKLLIKCGKRDIIIGIAAGLQVLKTEEPRFDYGQGARDVPLLHLVQTGSGAH
jgi:hypothetical protein